MLLILHVVLSLLEYQGAALLLQRVFLWLLLHATGSSGLLHLRLYARVNVQIFHVGVDLHVYRGLRWLSLLLIMLRLVVVWVSILIVHLLLHHLLLLVVHLLWIRVARMTNILDGCG